MNYIIDKNGKIVKEVEHLEYQVLSDMRIGKRPDGTIASIEFFGPAKLATLTRENLNPHIFTTITIEMWG